jgi:cytochrome P450
MFSRRVTEPLTLGGCTVPTGTMCLISPALLQRDPRWWTEPDQFRPQRWLRHEPGRQDSFDPRAPASRGAPSCPSGAGPRMCIGEQFTWAEAATVLAELGPHLAHPADQCTARPGPSSMRLRPKDPVKAITLRRNSDQLS